MTRSHKEMTVDQLVAERSGFVEFLKLFQQLRPEQREWLMARLRKGEVPSLDEVEAFRRLGAPATAD
jgi:uncharacterized protein Smg (DUF494 family)